MRKRTFGCYKIPKKMKKAMKKHVVAFMFSPQGRSLTVFDRNINQSYQFVLRTSATLFLSFFEVSV